MLSSRWSKSYVPVANGPLKTPSTNCHIVSARFAWINWISVGYSRKVFNWHSNGSVKYLVRGSEHKLIGKIGMPSFDNFYFWILKIDFSIFWIESENEIGVEVESSPHMPELIEIKPLGQIDTHCLDDSNNFSTPHNPTPSSEDGEHILAINPLESNEREVKIQTGAPHTCLDCGKCFQKRWNFIEHMRTHSNERAFECSLCHKKWVENCESFIFLYWNWTFSWF